MEACSTSHYWARCFSDMGHSVMLIPAQHVSPFVCGNKSDKNDAVAIGEASRRPNIKAVPVKSLEQQDIQALHRIRERYVSQRTALINQARGILIEFGIVAPQGHKSFCILLRRVSAPDSSLVSPLLKSQISLIAEDYYSLTDRIEDIVQTMTKIVNQNVLCRLLLTIPGLGVINASAIVSAIGDGSQFKNSREFAVWLGLTPRQSSSGEMCISGGITKRGNRYLRKQLAHGARTTLFRCRTKSDRLSTWANRLIERRGYNKATTAMAARMARICWVILNKKEAYKPSH